MLDNPILSQGSKTGFINTGESLLLKNVQKLKGVTQIHLKAQGVNK